MLKILHEKTKKPAQADRAGFLLLAGLWCKPRINRG